MPEQDNDRLEQFFRKAADRPDVTFNEDDWKKLEARLDAVDAAAPVKTPTVNRIVTAVVIGILLLSGGAIWLGARYDASEAVNTKTQPPQPADNNGQADEKTPPEISSLTEDAQTEEARKESTGELNIGKHSAPVDAIEMKSGSADARISDTRKPDSESPQDQAVAAEGEHEELPAQSEQERDKALREKVNIPAIAARQPRKAEIIQSLSKSKIHEELINISSANADKNKQEAGVELSGAEEADTPGVQSMVEEEHASDQAKHVAMPRLSLLLSFAPDFSSTSIEPYSAAGKAFGAVLHYHFRDRWSVSAGVIKNQKVYTGDGEDYTPPVGYWKYYTNGIIPETIDGSCSILEFPLMVQYVVANAGRNRFVVGAGTSSYLMQSESYRYHFSQPNPGAKEGWDSRGSSRFYFNMINITASYERQVSTGLSFGIEPYIKLPVEEIGWSNLKLYSMGASITMRYTLIHRKQSMLGAVRSRGPD